MSPPHVPGVPGMRLPEPWEPRMKAAEDRLTELERKLSATRETLQSYTDEEEDSQVKIPSDAPKMAKAGLGALAGLTPTGRAWVLGILGLAVIIAVTLLTLHGAKVF